MNYPLLSEYIEAIKSAEDNFNELSNLRPVLDDDGQPMMSSGNFAVVFKMKDGQTGKLHAVKCFLKEQEGRAEAYRLIAEELEFVNNTYLTPIKYLDHELFVDSKATGETEFPVLLMDWVEGQTLDKYIDYCKGNMYALHLLFGRFCQMAIWLLDQSFAHGDLKPENILVRKDGSIALVDYDGMYVPSMEGECARELGSPNYRHPLRKIGDFNSSIDIFPITSMALTLSYIAKRSEFNDFPGIEYCTLAEEDFMTPSRSQLVKDVEAYLNSICGKCLGAFVLSLSDFSISKTVIQNVFKSIVNDSTEASTTTDDKHCYSFDLEGVQYSFDGRKILHAFVENQFFQIREGVEILCNRCLSLCDNVTIYIPKSLKIIGNGVFGRVYHFVCDSKSFFLDDYGLYTTNRKQLIKCSGAAKKGIIPIYQETHLIDSYAFDTSDTYIPFVEINGKFYSLQLNGEHYIVNKEIGNLIEDENGAVYSKDWKKLYYYPKLSDAKEYVISDGCEEIADSAFQYLYELDYDSMYYEGNCIETLYFPSSLKKIGVNALLGCMSLRNIVIDIHMEESFVSLLQNYQEENVGPRKKIDSSMFIYKTSVSDAEKDNGVLDEYGVLYSYDGLKLISGKDIPMTYQIKEGTKIVCDDAFYMCNVPQIVLPESLVSIGCNSFSNCSFQHIFIPENVKAIGNYAFCGGGLVSVIISGKIQFMGTSVFSPDDAGSNLSYIVLYEGIEDLGNLTFRGCSELKEIVIPSTVKHIGSNPFSESGIRVIINKSSYFLLEDNCLYDEFGTSLISCISHKRDIQLDRVYYGGVHRVEDYAFAGNTYIESVNLPNTSFIGDYAFDGCCNLSEISLSDKLKSIGKWAFQSSALYEIDIPDTVHSLEEGTFNGCRSLQTVNLPKSLLKIGKHAFLQCSSLHSITLPCYVSTIDGNPFEDCPITINSLSSRYKSVEGGLYEVNSNTLICCFSDKDFFNIKDGTKTIGEWAFKGCLMNSLYIPESVKEIGDCAFWACKELKYIIIPKLLDKIGKSLFEFCDSLEHVYIEKKNKIYHSLYMDIDIRGKIVPLSKTTVLPFELQYAHDNDYCIYSPNREKMISYGNTYGDNYEIDKTTKIICDECFFDEYNEIDGLYIHDLYIPESVELIGKNPFCRSIEEIISDSFHYVVKGKFLLTDDCKKIVFYFGKERMVVIPNGITCIGSGAFCSLDLSTITISSTVNKIEDNPFVGAGNYSGDDSFPYEMKSDNPRFIVENNTLYDLEENRIISYWGNLEHVIIKDGVKIIGANSFFGAKMKQITLPSTIEYIDETSFYFCFNLNKIYVQKGKEYEIKILLPAFWRELVNEI